MQRDQRFFTGNPVAGMNQEFDSPFDGFEFQPSENCPKNFIIFDQEDNRSRVMFHPALAHKFSCPNFKFGVTPADDSGKNILKISEDENKFSSHKEDTKDIDALLGSEEDEDDDVVSTGRSPGNWGGSSPDSSSSTRGFKSREMKSFASQESFSRGASSNERKKERTKRMVRVLRGIIPGGEGMDTPAVLDEAVRYLKSLKVEVKKLGIENFKD